LTQTRSEKLNLQMAAAVVDGIELAKKVWGGEFPREHCTMLVYDLFNRIEGIMKENGR